MERPLVIHKLTSSLRPAPNWGDYEAERHANVWAQARRALQGLPGGGPGGEDRGRGAGRDGFEGMIKFKLPSLGADMDEGTLLEWRVKPGDAVKRGQVVAVVDTSKAAVDVEIWHDGVVHALQVAVGEKVPVGAVLATLLAPGEAAAHAAPRTEPATATVVAAAAAPLQQLIVRKPCARRLRRP